jgi:hypothetical protein
MTQALPDPDQVFAPSEMPLDAKIVSYVSALAKCASGTSLFRTGSGRIFRDLLIHWPTLENKEQEAQEICQRISDAVYPLAAALFAQAVEISLTISSTPIPAPTQIDALSMYVVFDTKKRVERRCFLSPRRPLPAAENLGTESGIVIACIPLNYRYHTLKDDRKRTGHPRAGLFELSQRLVNEQLYNNPSPTPRINASAGTEQPKPKEFPKATPSPSVGKLDKSATLNLDKKTEFVRSPLWALFPTPSPFPAPHTPVVRTKK